MVLAGKGKDGDGKVTKAAKEHPFPDAVSQGLAKPEVPQAPVGQDHVQVATTLRYDGTTGTASSPTLGGEDWWEFQSSCCSCSCWNGGSCGEDGRSGGKCDTSALRGRIRLRRLGGSSSDCLVVGERLAVLISVYPHTFISYILLYLHPNI